LFPAADSQALTLPIHRIQSTLAQLSRFLREESCAAIPSLTFADLKVQLFFTGHFLGAGLASLAYADALQLQSEQISSSGLILRDAYLFGTPQAGNYVFIASIGKYLHNNVNS
jgi:hypothetical protein